MGLSLYSLLSVTFCRIKRTWPDIYCFCPGFPLLTLDDQALTNENVGVAELIASVAIWTVPWRWERHFEAGEDQDPNHGLHPTRTSKES